MEITEVRIKLMENTDDRLRAFCSITFDDSFVVRDLKIIDGTSGPFVAMPSRKLTAHCPRCGYKNHLKAPYCNHCGDRLREDRMARDSEGRAKLYADIAHPINSACREMIQARVIAEFQSELQRSQQPGYVSRYDDDYGFEDDHLPTTTISGENAAAPIPSAVGPSLIPAPHVTSVAEAPAVNARESDIPAPHILPRNDAQAEREETSSTNVPRGRSDFGAGILD